MAGPALSAVGRRRGGMRAALTLTAVAALCLTGFLTGCSSGNDDPTVSLPSRVPASAAPPSPAATASAAVPSPAATARELARFSAVNRGTIERDRTAGGQAFVDGLAAAGYPRSAMQVTPDRTTIGLAAPSVQFSVLWQGVCLIGQYGPQSGGYHAVTAAPVSGRCLIGTTRPLRG